MSFHFEHIPYAELNRFYAEVVGRMHVSLRPLATDMRILRHEADERHSDNIAEEIYQPQYSHLPWMVAPYFDVPDDLLLKIGKAWWLTILDVVITDQIVDRQVPDFAGIPLMLQHVRGEAGRMYRQVFGHSERFWDRYEATLAGVWDALAHETYCVDQHQQVYSYEEMRRVCKSRSDLLCTIIGAMGDVSASGQNAAIEPLCHFYENLTFADQLLDDASDWKGDLKTGRYTLPIVMALEAAKIPLEDAPTLSLADFDLLMDRHRVLVRLSEQATTLLEECEQALSSLSPAETSLYHVLRQRLQTARYASKRYQTMRHMTAFLQKLSHG
jgi:hypothetical protein